MTTLLDVPADIAFARACSAPAAEEARDMLVRFLDVLDTRNRTVIERRFDDPSAVGMVVKTLTVEGWTIEEISDALLELLTVATALSHQAFLRAVASPVDTTSGYDYESLVLGVHDEHAPWHGMVPIADLTAAVEAASTGHIARERMASARFLDAILVCTSHALTATQFTSEFGWLDFVADSIAQDATDA